MSAKVTCLKCGASSSGTTDEVIAWDKAHDGACPAGVVTIIASGVSPDGVSWIVASKDGKLTLGVDPAHRPEREFPWAVENRVVKGPVVALFRDEDDANDYVQEFLDLRVRPASELIKPEPQGEPSDAAAVLAEVRGHAERWAGRPPTSPYAMGLRDAWRTILRTIDGVPTGVELQGEPSDPQPLALDPTPWVYISDQVFGVRSAIDKGFHSVSGGFFAFAPRAGYEQDRARYGAAGEAKR